MIDYTPAITALEAELAVIDARRPLLEAALTGLRRLSGDPPSDRRTATPRKAPRAAKQDGRTDGARVRPQ